MGLIDNLTKNYALPIAAAGVMAFSYSTKADDTLPIYSQTKQAIVQAQDRESPVDRVKQDNEIRKSLNEKVRVYNNTLESVKKEFNGYLLTREVLTVEKQERLLEIYNQAHSQRADIYNFISKNNIEESFSKNIKPVEDKLYRLIYKNLYENDFGMTTALEKELKKDGINIPVEGNFSNIEKLWTALLLGVGLPSAYIIFRPRKKNNKRESIL